MTPDKVQLDRGNLSLEKSMLASLSRWVDVLRKEVIGNVSHELRAHLSLISGYGELIRDIDWKEEEKRSRDLELIIKEARRMSVMVDDILDYSQLQAGYYKLRKIPPRPDQSSPCPGIRMPGR